MLFFKYRKKNLHPRLSINFLQHIADFNIVELYFAIFGNKYTFSKLQFSVLFIVLDLLYRREPGI